MNTTGASVLAYGPSSSDVYDADEAFLTGSPMLQPLVPKLQPSPSPPPTIIPPKVRSSGGDAILVSFLDGGRRPEIAAEAGERPLASDGDEDEEDEDEGRVGQGGLDDHSSVTSNDTEDSRDIDTKRPNMSDKPRLAGQTPGPLDLKSLAAGALAAFSASRSPESTHLPNESVKETAENRHAQADTPLFPSRSHEAPNDVRPVQTAPISPPAPSSQDPYSPRQSFHAQVLMHPKELKSPTSTLTQRHGELPPIQMVSPKSDINGQAPLPSLRAHLGDQLTDPANSVEKEIAMRRGSAYPHSPPSVIPRLGAMASQASPPISPNDFRRDMPSPAHSIPAISPSFYYSSSSASQPRSGADYSSSSNTETPNTEQSASTPANPSDKMSIDSMTNPAGAYVCNFAGCTAAPFQTQYLLNSHANVHSSARPHYCSVKGCPRSEGGKGFKRKNEMIRHGLVHDSPGYVCPFCPDREHKYPRPDNLQRHVRVHHVDKDKDDPLLRDVLSQRPDGPSRGRRRRGGP